MSTRRVLKIDEVVCWVDTREQLPFDLHLPSRVVSLDVGDYTIRSLSHMVRVERKSMQDLVMCCGRERERFQRSIDRMRRFHLPMLVIECPEKDIREKKYFGEMSPKAIMNSVHAWRAKGINVAWCDGRDDAALTVSRTLFSFANEHRFELWEWEERLKLCRQEISA